MESKDSRPFLWVVKNPLGANVGVTTDTYDSHIIGDHPDDKARDFVGSQVKGVIEEPRFIYFDNEHATNQRVKYIDYVSMEEYGKIQSLVVVVETDREPNEIVTWSVKSSTRQEKGGIIYDSREDKRKSD